MALAWAGAALSVVVAVVATVATVGAASPTIMASISAGAAMIGAAASVTSVALEQGGALEKMSPELRKGIEIALMVVQLACALVSIGAAVKSALSSIPKIATTALKATASGAAEGAAEGTAAATKTAEAAADAAIEASKASMKEMVEEAVKEAAKNAAKQVAKDTAEELAKTGGKELTKEAAEQIASKAVSSATKEAVSSVTKQIIDKTLDKTARVVSKEVAEEIAKKAAAEVSKDIAKSVTAELGEASQVGSVVNEVAADAIAAGAKAAVEDISKYVIFKLTATIAEKFTSVASSGVAASEGVENIQTGQLAMKQSDLQKEISELVAAIQMTQHMIQTLIDWLKGIGEAYMNADQKGRELSENFSKSANLAIDGISAAPISPGAASV
ncbi:MAG: hypothetical protein GY948_18620 [Alphaproteobacteria bacterium]|nr:hypothetical protein [Alphaproteobacteria bacterium]